MANDNQRNRPQTLIEKFEGGAKQIGDFFSHLYGSSGKKLPAGNVPVAFGGYANEKAGNPSFSAKEQAVSRNNNKPVHQKSLADLSQNTVRSGRGGGARSWETEEEQSPSLLDRMSFEDALEKAMQYLTGSGGGGTDFSAVEGQLRKNTSEADARLEAMYRQLRGSIDSDAPVLAKHHDEAISGVNAATDAGVSNINNAYTNTRNEQTRQLEALGIGDAAAVLAGNGGDAARDQEGAVTQLETNRGANVNQLTANKAAAQTYNTNISNAAGLEGNLQRATLQSRLADKLAEVQTQRSSQQDDTRQQQLGLAMQLYDRNGDEYNRQQDSMMEQQSAYADFIAEQQKDAQKQALGGQKDQRSTYLGLLKTFDGDETRAKEVLQNMINAGML